MNWLARRTVALLETAARVTAAEIEARPARLRNAEASAPSPRRIEQREADLHVDIVLRCRNRVLGETIRRSQLPILATHATFDRRRFPDEIATMLREHQTVLLQLGQGRAEAAAAALEQHLRRSLEPNVELLLRLDPLPPDRRPPYLIPSEPMRPPGILKEHRSPRRATN